MSDSSQKAPAPSMGISIGDLVTRSIKYLLEGLAVAIAAYLIAGKKLRMDEIGTLALTALAVFAILDLGHQQASPLGRLAGQKRLQGRARPGKVAQVHFRPGQG